VESFLALDDTGEQWRFWSEHLNTLRFRWALDTLLSWGWWRPFLADLYPLALPEDFGEVVRKRLERGWKRHQNRVNPYARAILLGGGTQAFADSRPASIRFVCSDAASYLESCPVGSFDAFTISNILDGAPPEYQRRLFAALKRAGTPEAVVVLRSFADPLEDRPFNVAAQDRSMLWGRVEVRPVRAFESVG
jgi:hypothetical protein